ncbi:MAG: STAS domain-containing protein [Woeseia sp.]|nr:STAS domain-containing protein [Woeseia sp.]MBT8097995.1 STAS domain-containing protein [Woeseia sp.]NNE61988.1 STAS domain-containing protein [Woeseia sp.]NNL55130.1 STAS domain-containing protein [Woeseia sp.]
MFEIAKKPDGTIAMAGRLDAAKANRAQEFLDAVDGPCVIDLHDLEYISSAGLGVLLRTHKRLMTAGGGLELVNVNKHINDIFAYSGFDKLFKISAAATKSE